MSPPTPAVARSALGGGRARRRRSSSGSSPASASSTGSTAPSTPRPRSARACAARARSTAEEQRRCSAAYVAGGDARARSSSTANADVSVTDARRRGREGGAATGAQAVFSAQNSRRATVDQCLDGRQAGARRDPRRNRPRPPRSTSATRRPRARRALTPPGESAPVLAYDFADPFVLRARQQLLRVRDQRGRRVGAGGAQHATSRTGTSSATRSPTSRRGRSPGSVWAPAALQRGRRARVLYYTVREASTGPPVPLGRGRRVARADRSSTGRPRRWSAATTGAIDPSPFVDANGARVPAVQDRAPGADLEPAAHRRTGARSPGPAHAACSRRRSGGRAATSRRRRCCAPAARTGSSTPATTGTARRTRRVSRAASARPGRAARTAANPILASHAGRRRDPAGERCSPTRRARWWLAYHAYQEPLVQLPEQPAAPLRAASGSTARRTPTVSP